MHENRASRAIVFGFITLFLLGIGSVALAFRTFPDRLRSPFNLRPPSTGNPLAFSGNLENELESSTKDTDEDGIPDLREREVYGTSPYLPDTDSDGLTDKQEIDKGEDPNCPQGTDCRVFRFPSSRDVEQDQIVRSLYESTLAAKFAEGGIPGLTDAPAIRNFLRQGGVSEKILSQFDDKTLVQIFQEAARQTPPPADLSGQARDSSQTPPSPEGGGGSGQLPENPTPAQIRELLIGAGIEKAVLEKFNDEQLVSLYRDALKDISNVK